LRDKPDVVLLDVNMPTLSGDTIAKILGRVSQNMDTLILLHSSLSIDSLRLEAIATGAHGYIQKTDSATELVRRIEYWINRSRYATSSKRLEAAPAAGNTGDGETRSSSRFAVASNVGRTIGAAGAANSATMEPLAAASSGSNRTASSSTRLRAATAAMTGPPGAASSSGSMPAVTATRGSITAGPLVTDSAPPPGSTATSRNMRAVKSAVAGGNRPAKVLFVDDDWKMLSSYRTMVAGYLDAEFVSSSDDAFNRLLADAPPQVVVCDVVMRGLSGADIYRRAVLLDRRWANRFVLSPGRLRLPPSRNFSIRLTFACSTSRWQRSACSIPSNK
jgi:DNA-binding NarL/FixJ family response regulator